MLANVSCAESLDVSLRPQHSICPNESYTCEVDHGTKISWVTENTDADGLEYSLLNLNDKTLRETKDFVGYFTGGKATNKLYNYNSTLFIQSPQTVNGTSLTCRGEVSAEVKASRKREHQTTRIRIIGNKIFLVIVFFIQPNCSPNVFLDTCVITLQIGSLSAILSNILNYH